MSEMKAGCGCGPSCCADPAPPSAGSRQGEDLVQVVRDRYGRIATGATAGCGTFEHADVATISTGLGYDTGDLAGAAAEANLGLGCGAPIGHLALQAGETVLDLGSGPGLDAFLAVRAVGPTGRVIGVDMTPAMLERARATAAKHGISNVEFREGRLEQLPLDDGSVDAVTSNCVINLVPDKAAVFREVARVLRPGGRLVISDVVLDADLPKEIEDDLLAYGGCVAGAMRREAYFELVKAAGLSDVEILRDEGQMAGWLEGAPDEVRTLEKRTGIQVRDYIERVRSVTYRATKPAASAR